MKQPSPLLEERPSPRFSALTAFVLRHRALTLCAIGLISALSAFAIITRLKVDNSLEVFAPAESPALAARERYRDLFGRDDLFLIALRGDVMSREFLERVDALERDVRALEVEVETLGYRRGATPSTPPPPSEDLGFGAEDPWGGVKGGSVVEETVSIVSARRTLSRGGALSVERWFDPLPADDAELRARAALALRDPLIARRLVDEAGRLSVLTARVAFMHDDDLGRVSAALTDLARRHEAPGFSLSVTGPPAINAALNDLVLNDLSRLLSLSGLAMFLALIYLFRSPIMVVGPLVVVSLAVLWTMGLMAALGMGLNLLSSILPAFLLCVGLGDSIHVQSLYRDLRAEGLEGREGLVRACGLTGLPVLFTSLTTMSGLLSFQFATVTAVQEMGLAGGVGVMFALLLSLTLLPITLDLIGAPQARSSDTPLAPPTPPTTPDLLDRVISRLVGLSEGSAGRAAVVWVSVALTALALAGAARLEVWHDDLETLPDSQPIKAAVREVDRALGGVAGAQLVINAPGPLGIRDLDLLRRLDALAQDLLAYESPKGERLVGHVLSPVDVIKETRRALLGDQLGEAAYALPETQEEASQLMALFELQSPDELRRLATIDLSAAHMTLQVKWQEATSYSHLIDFIQGAVSKHMGERARVEPTGGIYLAYTVVSSLLSDLLNSFSSAFLVITLLMVLMLRDVKLGVLAMVPNLFPILLMLGGLGWCGVPLDLNNLLIASIALGIAVDDTIHFLHHFWSLYLPTGDREAAIHGARVSAGRAMVSTSALLGAGFSVYLLASTEAVRRFGVVIALTLLAALIVDLVLCPAILRLAYRPQRVLRGAST